MDQELYAISAQFAEAAVRNTASAVLDRISTARARKDANATIVQLEEIINDLLTDKGELVSVGQAYEDALVAQRISPSDVEYISNNVVPLFGELLNVMGSQQAEALQVVERLLSVETVTILQLVRFNFKKAIGEPLTELMSSLIRSRLPSSTKPVRNPSQKPRR